ncbi:MAG TPA: metal-dependent hydrolase [Candidatus Angelobacter sp.]|nr:metal-dependent hydrolase [Candidatus Angelobacter sp.]
MASLFTHAVVGAAIGHTGNQELRKDWRFWVAVVACSVLPDVDSLGFQMGVPYGALWGHRGMTHSLLFALFVAAFLALLLDGRFHLRWRLAILFFLVTASHGVLDAMTNGGLGVAFFSPFDTQRFFFPWRPIPVSPIGVGVFFTARGARILRSEILWIWCPTLFVLAVVHLARSLRRMNRLEASALSNDQG